MDRRDDYQLVAAGGPCQRAPFLGCQCGRVHGGEALKARMWQEDRPFRTVNTGDGFVTVRKGQVVIVFVAEPNEPVMKFLTAAMENAAPLDEEP